MPTKQQAVDAFKDTVGRRLLTIATSNWSTAVTAALAPLAGGTSDPTGTCTYTVDGQSVIVEGVTAAECRLWQGEFTP